MIIAVSDTHLGYSKCDKNAFSRFLDWVALQEDVTDIVLAGDIIDFWRRGMVSVTIEISDITAKLINLSKGGMRVHYIAGNHDYVVRHLEIFPNQFKFSTKVELVEDGVKYTFIHGWELDPDQNPAFFDALCWSNDNWGRRADRVWDVYSKWIDNPQKRIIEWFRQWWAKRDIEKMSKPPHERDFIKVYGAFAEQTTPLDTMVASDDMLIYGHTHIPCIIESENQVNCGSWIRNEDHHAYNTYVVIDGNEIQLRRFTNGV